MSLKIAHLSDPHFGTVWPHVQEALFKSLRANQPDVIVLSGDITQRARKSQFISARQFLDRLQPIPVLTLPGNHDIPLFNVPLRLMAPYFGYQKYLRPQLQDQYEKGDVEVTTLKSTRRWRHVQGQLNEEDLQFLGSRKSETQVRIAAFHHPLDCRRPEDVENLLRRRDEVMHSFSKQGIDVVLGGHIHDPYVTLSSVRYPEVAHPMLIGVAGTCLSWRTRADAPNSYYLLDIQTEPAAQILWTRWDLKAQTEFQLTSSREFHRTPAGWREH